VAKPSDRVPQGAEKFFLPDVLDNEDIRPGFDGGGGARVLPVQLMGELQMTTAGAIQIGAFRWMKRADVHIAGGPSASAEAPANNGDSAPIPHSRVLSGFMNRPTPADTVDARPQAQRPGLARQSSSRNILSSLTRMASLGGGLRVQRTSDSEE